MSQYGRDGRMKQQRTILVGATFQVNAADEEIGPKATTPWTACLDSIVHHPLHGHQRPHLLRKGVMTGGRSTGWPPCLL